MSTTQQVFEFGRISRPQDWLTVALIGIVFAGLVVWIYRREWAGRSTATAVGLLILRLMAVGLIGWMLLDPRFRVETTVIQQPRVLVLVDRSRSMAHTDQNHRKSKGRKLEDSVPGKAGPKKVEASKQADFGRWTQAVQALAGESGTKRWAKGRDVEIQAFGRNVESVPNVDSLAGLTADHEETRLGDAVVAGLSDRSRRPPAAIVVVSDGGLNMGAGVEEAVKAATASSTPIFGLSIGSEDPIANVRVTEVRFPPRVFRGDDLAVGSASIQITGPVPKTFTVQTMLRNVQSKSPPVVLETTQVAFNAESSSVAIKVQFLPKEIGRWEISVSAPTFDREDRVDDNTAFASVDVVDQKTKVLLAAKIPSREYQFLRSVLARDRSVELSVLLQSAAKGAVQESVTVLDKFPQERADFFTYDCLVMLDPDWLELGEASSSLILDWVAQQSGGLLYAAGPIHTPNITEGSPASILLPVVPRKLFFEDGGPMASDVWPIEFASEGSGHPAFRLDDDPAKSRAIWRSFEGFYACMPMARAKPGATVWATLGDPKLRTGSGGASAVFASQFYGSGRVYYLGSAELWRLRRLSENYYERLWTQLVRSVGEGRLLRGSGRGGFLLDEREYAPGSAITVRAFALDERFQPLSAEGLSASASTSAGPRELMLKRIVGQPGRFEGVLPALPPGPVRLQASIGGGFVLEDQFQVRESRLEADDLRMNRALLERLTKDNKGSLRPIEKIADLDDLLPRTPDTVVLAGTPTPVWDTSWMILAFTALLAVEWLWRKFVRLA